MKKLTQLKLTVDFSICEITKITLIYIYLHIITLILFFHKKYPHKHPNSPKFQIRPNFFTKNSNFNKFRPISDSPNFNKFNSPKFNKFNKFPTSRIRPISDLSSVLMSFVLISKNQMSYVLMARHGYPI